MGVRSEPSLRREVLDLGHSARSLSFSALHALGGNVAASQGHVQGQRRLGAHLPSPPHLAISSHSLASHTHRAASPCTLQPQFDPLGPATARPDPKQNSPAFVTFLTAGFPSVDATVPLMLAMERGGADIIELGVPFTDPLADGKAIQECNNVSPSARNAASRPGQRRPVDEPGTHGGVRRPVLGGRPAIPPHPTARTRCSPRLLPPPRRSRSTRESTTRGVSSLSKRRGRRASRRPSSSWVCPHHSPPLSPG